MTTRPSGELRKLIVELAGGRCEYCLMPQELVATAHQICDGMIPSNEPW